jgi:hypothetical protein
MTGPDAQFDAWNPGIASAIPARLLPLVTLYRPENSSVGYREARELAEICGLNPYEMTAFGVRRLVVHELLIRVTADLHVPDGPNYADLGLRLRGMTARILEAHVEPKIGDLERAFDELRDDIDNRLRALLDRDIFARPAPVRVAKQSILARIFGKKEQASAEETLPELIAITRWENAIPQADSQLEKVCLQGLRKIVSGIVGQRGRLMADRDTVVRLASNWICNSYGSDRIGDMLDPIIRDAAAAENYKYLPFQNSPVILNVKGASAAGKSTIRPLQRQLAQRLGVPWEYFALISPDYWRKFLLDYKSLGDDQKYAAMLTGQELEIIDKKLDGYIERKATRSELPHLLIDRFRFDSFQSGTSQPADSRLLSRFGDTVFMFFVITPPAETVERAWTRGIETGRYKAVDDLLYHNIEAYTGMPQLFFTWVKKDRQKVHFEFLDNSIPYGETPRSVAFGWNDKIAILDLECLRKMVVYQRINVDARKPEDVLLRTESPSNDIVLECIRRISDVTFVDPGTLEVVGHTKNGKCDYEVFDFFRKLSIVVEYTSEYSEILCLAESENRSAFASALNFDYEKTFTVGSWKRG